ncbi:hypothetical protein WN48_01010 [Eufriesea mexicana]|nr:hypothetical protein WN48_01010 [Eufriesea mexicana]
MSQRFVCALLTTGVVCYALAESNEFAATSEFVKKQPTGDRPLANIVRARNFSETPYPNNAEGYNNNLDKQTRTADHRCCGSRYGSNSSTRPDSYHNKIHVDSGRYSTKFGERLPVDRYGWQTQGPPGFGGGYGRPGGYGATAFYEGAQVGDKFGSRPSYGSESFRKPGGYDSGVSGEHGGYSFSRPTGYGGSVSGGGHGISGTFANGDEFGPVEPSYPEGHAPAPPNIQAQKAVALKALAGVALIGAAAALATNPVLLPLGVVSGRRKRSSLFIKDKDAYMDYILRNFKSNVTEVVQVSK